MKHRAIVSCLSVFSIVMSGCAPQGDGVIDLVFDPCEPLVLELVDATDEQRASTLNAVSMWNELAGAQLVVEQEIADAPLLPVHFEEAGANFHGYYDDERAVVYINDLLANPRERAITLAHEIGHAFGLLHDDERASVMNSGNLKIEPNEGDEDALVRLWGQCPL